MDIVTLPALSDNYMYLLIDKVSKTCAAVDPVEPDKIINAVQERGLKLASVITTHHHWDHAGGNVDLVNKLKKNEGIDIQVYGGDDRIGALTNSVSHGDRFKVGNNLKVECLATPCHTTGHICYYVTEGDENTGVVFTGDTLFLGGCGRFFEGTATEMFKSLIETLAKLPKSTKVFCGHEYTLTNLKFGLTVEPDNEAIKKRLKTVEKLRASNQPTVPGTIGEELETNPFMRVDQIGILKHAKTNDPIEAMKIIRLEKDKF